MWDICKLIIDKSDRVGDRGSDIDRKRVKTFIICLRKFLYYIQEYLGVIVFIDFSARNWCYIMEVDFQIH